MADGESLETFYTPKKKHLSFSERYAQKLEREDEAKEMLKIEQ